ncbi:hypothetical protein ABT075_32055 [Streptomyces sp. NPDC002677]|uniref:hypothetical protein n=1 Tax=Streptomyces sp. NPDC002677 TaxID=3154774 RepID=UPI00332F6A79
MRIHGHTIHVLESVTHGPSAFHPVLEQLLDHFPELRLAPGYHREAPPGPVMIRRPARLDVVL